MTETIEETSIGAAAKPRADAKDRKALAKGSSIVQKLSELSRDNAKACAATGKIAFGGLAELGKANVAEVQSACAQLSAGLKDLTAVQSPIDFYKLQGAFFQSSFRSAIAFNMRNRETLVKLAEEAAAPLKQQAHNLAAAFRKSA